MGIATKIGALVFAMVLVAAAAVGVAVFEGGNAILIRHELDTLTEETRRDAVRLAASIEAPGQDVLFLANTPSVQGIVRAREAGSVDPQAGWTEVQWKDQLALIFAELLRFKPSYLQARLIGVADGGREIVRVEKVDSRVQRVPEDELQHKAQRTYFLETIVLRLGEVFLSEVNLNRERGVVEVPHKPMLRVATPVRTAGGEAVGIVVINMDPTGLLQLHSGSDAERVHRYVTNDRGDFLSHPDAALDFGFDLGERHIIQETYPELKSLFEPDSANTGGQVRATLAGERYIVSFLKVPFDPRRPKRFIGLARAVPEDVTMAESTALRNRSIILASVIIAVATLIAILLFSRIASRPIVLLSASAAKIGAGDLSERVKIGSSDELGELARAFNNMADALTRSRAALEQEHADLESSMAELRRTQAQLVQSAKMAAIGELAAGVAHELNNPLSGVLTYAHLLKEKLEATPEQIRASLPRFDEQLDEIKDAAERCKAISDNLLTFSRQSSHDMGLVDIANLVTRTFDLIGVQLRHEQVKVVREIADDLPPVRGNANQLQQVLTNIVLNAVQAMGTGGEVTVSARVVGDRCEITIADTGPGISEDNLDRIFEPFFTTKPVGKGTGLGLSIVYGIIESHEGDIKVQSTIGQGTTFQIQLPLAPLEGPGT